MPAKAQKLRKTKKKEIPPAERAAPVPATGGGRAVGRGSRRVISGLVKRDRMNKTITVEIGRLVRHPKFGKYLKRRTMCKAHDEKNEAHEGDVVEIMETRPLSATKRWRLVRVLRRFGKRTPVEAS